MNLWQRFRLNNSLLSQYLLIVLSAVALLPLTMLLVSALKFSPEPGNSGNGLYRNGEKLKQMWHEEATKLGASDDQEIERELKRLKERYAKANLFWVDGTGTTRLQLPEQSALPQVWTAAFTVQFMKERHGGEPFTVVAFIGGKPERGFIVFDLPRSVMRVDNTGIWDSYAIVLIACALLIFGLFLFISLLFFNRIRKRLVYLQIAMTYPYSGSGIPGIIPVGSKDEIGRLEGAFNDMVRKLEASREREIEEEALRRDLFAKLSHDLRTPLTTIQGHAYSLRCEPLSASGKQSVELIEHKIGYLNRLIENLFSYSLLSSGKFPYRPRNVDIVRTVRTLFAGWYPVFEQEKFTIELDLPDTMMYWKLDPEWLERILDNYLQNVLRHAKSGRYIAITVTDEGEGAIAISDRGPGMGGRSAEQGAGLGLSIVSLMLKEMGLYGQFESNGQREGTTVTIRPARKLGG